MTRSNAAAVTGRCACGACTVRAERLSRELSACWCGPCRRWQGLVGMGLDAHEADCRIAGPVRLWRSSAFAERAFCGACASPLWFRDRDSDTLELCPGLFEDAAGAQLHHENFVDRRPETIRFDPEPHQISAADYAAKARVTDGGGAPLAPDPMAGGCACGAVRFRLAEAQEGCGMCHCDTCRRWTGGVFCVVATRREHLAVAGDPALIRWVSSPGVERVSCGECGGKLWYEVVGPEGDATNGKPGDIEVCLGALDDMGGRPLGSEIFIDAKPRGYAFAGTHPRRTRAEALG